MPADVMFSLFLLVVLTLAVIAYVRVHSNNGFDKGVKAERERIVNEIKNEGVFVIGYTHYRVAETASVRRRKRDGKHNV